MILATDKVITFAVLKIFRNLQSFTKHTFERNSGFNVKYSTLWQKFNFCFSGDFCQHLQNLHFGRRTRHLAIILSRFDTFLLFPNFLSLKSFGNL